ncbi:MAG: YbhB/YbcL family Raf kinase inhibitor-like protein [Actinomycetes bacterium]|jgi:Raf kinase inhibitor-like YbhB/YbcL family protein
MGLNIANLKIQSTEFASGGKLSAIHSQDEENKIPQLEISGVPSNAKELVVICHDPDAPLPHGFTHWTLYGIPADTTDIGPGSDAKFKAGPNGMGAPGYLGPQPPVGHGVHHYYFWVYALDTVISGTPTREEFLSRYSENIVEQNRVVATFQR